MSWNKEDIARGFVCLELAAEENLSRYHLEAAIASCHAFAASYDKTPWNQLLELYDALVIVEDSPVVRLNQIVALAGAKGVDTALVALDDLGRGGALDRHHLYYATRGEMLRRAGKIDEARVAFERAIELCENKMEREFLKRKLVR